MTYEVMLKIMSALKIICLLWRFIVSGEELKSSIVPNRTGVFRFDVKYNLSEETVR